MNKTHFYTLSSALLASTALSGAANAGTIGKYTALSFSSATISIDNTLFSTTASTANAVTIGGGALDRHIGMQYNNNFDDTTHWNTEFTISGARFITGAITTGNVVLWMASAGNAASATTSFAGSVACASVTSLVNLIVVNDCNVSAAAAQVTGNGTGIVHGISLSGITFNNASGLATAGTSVTLTGIVYNTANSTQVFEASSTGNILTSRLPLEVRVIAGVTGSPSATTTPIAFTSLSAPASSTLSLVLATVFLSSTNTFAANLNNTSVATSAGTTNITVSSSILSSAAVRSVRLDGPASAGSVALTALTADNFSRGTVTFSVTNAMWTGGNSAAVMVIFQGTTAIPSAVAGTVTGTLTYNGNDQAMPAYSGVTASISQGGFSAEVNTFNASTNGPFSSYLRVHNNGQIAGTVTITVTNDDYGSGAVLGSSFTTASILPNATLQLSAAEMEGATTSVKLPAGGANIATASRTGSYTLRITGPIIGYVQHILFDGNSVADLSGYRNSGATTNQP